MATKNILKNNRVYLNPYQNELKNKSNLLSKLSNINSNDEEEIIIVADGKDFQDSGILIINGEEIHYGAKIDNSFHNIKRGYNNTIIGEHIKGSTVYQYRNKTNINNTSNGANGHLAGWYINNNQQATLKIGNANTIIPGVIRYCDGPTPVFQGCANIDKDGNPVWVDFNSTKGEKGENGDINTLVKYNNIGEGEGSFAKMESSETENSSLFFRTLKSAVKTENGKEVKAFNITTQQNEIVIDTAIDKDIIDLSDEIEIVKGNPLEDKILNCYGSKIKIRAGNEIKKGQVVYLSFNNNAVSVSSYKTENNLEPFGISLQNAARGDIILIMKKGSIGLVKMDCNVVNTTTDCQINAGSNILLDNEGFGYVCNNKFNLPKSYWILGKSMETSSIKYSNDYKLIEFNPKLKI